MRLSKIHGLSRAASLFLLLAFIGEAFAAGAGGGAGGLPWETPLQNCKRSNHPIYTG